MLPPTFTSVWRGRAC